MNIKLFYYNTNIIHNNVMLYMILSQKLIIWLVQIKMILSH